MTNRLSPGQYNAKPIAVKTDLDGTILQTFELENGERVVVRTRPASSEVDGMRQLEARVAELEARLGLVENIARNHEHHEHGDEP